MQREYSRGWTRFHDDPRTILINPVSEVDYPNDLADVIELCRDRPPQSRLRAAGSHWALSEAAISDDVFVESHDPQDQIQGMDRTLTNVVPGCLHADVVERMKDPAWPSRYGTLIHFESGKRIYQAYAEMEQVDQCDDPATLGGYIRQISGSSHFAGPWAFETLGGAGGQTVVGAFSTGTHGGDFDRGAVADSVVAIHLVADGGDHYWIEAVDDHRYHPQLTDDAKLRALYAAPEFGGPAKFHIIRDNNVLNAARVAVGRFGIIYSVVVRATPQYALWERRRLHLWQDVKQQISVNSPGNPGLFQDPLGQAPNPPQRFLQVVVCLTPHLNFHRNLVGVTKRWQVPLAMGPQGLTQRVGVATEQGERLVFDKAGRTHPYAADENHPEQAGSGSLLERVCASGSFLRGVLELVYEEIKDFVESNGAAVGAGIAAVAAAGGAGLLTMLGALALVALAIKELLEAFGADDRLGEALEAIKNKLLDPNEPDPLKRAAGLFAWQLIAYGVFQAMQGDQDYCARSYAVMDGHDYLDQSCQHNVASVEVFFDANDSRLIAFIDALIAFEIQQELRGKSFLGYASLRFMGPTQATIGPQQWDRSCAVEVAGLKDMSGSEEMVEYATQLALNPNMGGILHWGQYNPSNRQQVEQRFGGKLTAWRAILGQFNGPGGFSSAFTRRVGLEP